MLSALFGRKRARRDEDRVWMTRRAKMRALLAQPGRLVAHFPATRRDLQSLARQEGRHVSVELAAGLVEAPERDAGLLVVVAERHPLREHDERVVRWADASAGAIVFHVSLDDEPLARFAAERVQGLLARLGGSPDEALESRFLSRAIENAQAKVAKAATGDQPADSAEDWLRVNGGASA